jgi:hypothetical protein
MFGRELAVGRWHGREGGLGVLWAYQAARLCMFTRASRSTNIRALPELLARTARTGSATCPLLFKVELIWGRGVGGVVRGREAVVGAITSYYLVHCRVSNFSPACGESGPTQPYSCIKYLQAHAKPHRNHTAKASSSGLASTPRSNLKSTSSAI